MHVRAYLPLVLVTLIAPTYAGAGNEQVIQLENQTTAGRLISGTCGIATIQITDAEKDSPIEPTGFSALYTAMTIRSGKSVLRISPDPESASKIFLQDRNKVHCVSTPSGPKLVLAMICYGRSCAPIDYRVIDPKTVKVINALTSMDECDDVCAENALGVALPASLRE